MSNFVRMFKPQFAELVESGQKRQTVRPTPKRMPKPGDTISLRCWSGSPYRSKQRVLREAVIKHVYGFGINKHGIMQLGGLVFSDEGTQRFAQADGFSCAREMVAWFEEVHGLPFNGILIEWSVP